MTTAAALVRAAHTILLDFDGPVTPLMPPPTNLWAADATRAAIPASATALPEAVATTTDHLAVLRWAGTRHPEVLEAVEKAAIEAEVNAAQTSTPTAGALEFLNTCARAGKTVVVVSNNSAEAVHTYLNRFHAHKLVRAVIGRARHRPDLMKPHPSLVLAALEVVNATAADAILIGDSISDIQVSHATGLRAVGYAKTPQREAELKAATADAITHSMRALCQSEVNDT